MGSGCPLVLTTPTVTPPPHSEGLQPRLQSRPKARHWLLVPNEHPRELGEETRRRKTDGQRRGLHTTNFWPFCPTLAQHNTAASPPLSLPSPSPSPPFTCRCSAVPPPQTPTRHPLSAQTHPPGQRPPSSGGHLGRTAKQGMW